MSEWPLPFRNPRELRDAGRWGGAQLEVWREVGGELPETVLPHHGVAMTLGPTDALEVSFAGERAERGSLTPGAVCVIPAGVPYRVRRLQPVRHAPSRMLVLGLDPAFVSSACGTRRAQVRPSFAKPDPLVSSLLQALASEAQQGHPSPVTYGEALLVALAAHLGRTTGEATAGERAQRVREFILDQLGAPLSLAQLAAVAGCDVRSFTRWFRSEFGTSPHRFLSAARVERARSRLAGSSDSLARIALEGGFSSQSHLTTVFRQHTGITPAAYRRQFTR